jgi:hypothetical protein
MACNKPYSKGLSNNRTLGPSIRRQWGGNREDWARCVADNALGRAATKCISAVGMPIKELRPRSILRRRRTEE